MAAQEALFPPTSLSMIDALANPQSPMWAKFARIYGPIIFTLARRAGLHEIESEEVVAAVMSGFAQRMRSEFHVDYTRGSFRSYLRTMARNEIGNLRKRKSRSNAPLDDVDKPTDADDPVRLWHDVERLERLAECLRRLRESGDISPRDYAAFERYAIHELPADAVAREFGIPTKRVYAIKHDVLRRLRTIFQQLEAEYGEA